MKTFFVNSVWIVVFFLAVLLPHPLLAVTMSVEYQGQVLLDAEAGEVSYPIHVGALTERVFQSQSVPYEGSELGMSSIFEIEQYLDILSKSEMKAYGWCFSVDGTVPETLTHQTWIDNPKSHVRWFFAHAHYVSGVWLNQCAEDERAL